MKILKVIGFDDIYCLDIKLSEGSNIFRYSGSKLIANNWLHRCSLLFIDSAFNTPFSTEPK